MQTYVLDDIEIDGGRGEIRRSGEPIAVESKVLGLLLQLIEAEGRVVSQAEIFARLWPEVRVSSDAIYRIVKEARALLGDDGRRQRIIRTLPGRGWRFDAEVDMRPAVADATPAVDLDLVRREAESGQIVAARARALELARTLDGSVGVEDRARALVLAADLVVHETLDHHWLDLCEPVVEALPTDATTLRAELSCRLAYQLYWSREPARSRRANAEARRLAEGVGASGVLAWVDLVDHMHCEGPARLGERRRHAEDALQHALGAGLPQVELWAREQVAHDAFEAGDLKRVEAEADAIELLVERGELPWSARVRTLLQLHRGEFAAAERALLSELGRLRDAGTYAFQYLGGPLLWLHAEQGRLGEIIDLLRLFVAAGGEIAIWRAALARAEWMVGNVEGARREYEGLAARDFRGVEGEFVAPATLSHLAELCASFRDVDRCGWLRERLAPYSGRFVVVPRASFSLGPADLALGRLATTAGDVEAGRRHLERALVLCEQTGARPARLHTHLAFAELLDAAQAGASEEAEHHLAEAAMLAEVLGMQGPAARTRSVCA